jgi:2-amino-4-hydroxy-6-hydroxymethyldihydropteridine diphosphokinase
MKKAFLIIGGNIGDRLGYINAASGLIKQQCGEILHQSSVYETAPWGKTDQPAFLNQVLEINTLLTPMGLLATILDIESGLGRQRKEKYDARTIDIDILYFEDETVNTLELTIPHPKIRERRFVLIPLAEIAPNLIDPSIGLSVTSLLDDCIDKLGVTVFNTENK